MGGSDEGKGSQLEIELEPLSGRSFQTSNPTLLMVQASWKSRRGGGVLFSENHSIMCIAADVLFCELCALGKSDPMGDTKMKKTDETSEQPVGLMQTLM